MSDNLKSFETQTDTIADGDTLTVPVSVGEARFISTLVDAGDGESPPATYDLAWQQRPVRKEAHGDDAEWITTATETGTTKRWWLQERPVPNYWRAVLTNRSGGEATFRVRLLSHGGDE